MSQCECVFRPVEWEEGSSHGETFEVKTVIRIKQGHHCPLHPQMKPKKTWKRNVNEILLFDRLRLEAETLGVVGYGFSPVELPTYYTTTYLYATS